jgi:CheY-like chemotaxis protein
MFAIALPEGSTLASAPPTDQTPFPTASPSFTIGLVEDNPDVLNAMVLGLQNLGHTVFAGTSGAALMEQLGPRAPDVLVSDYRLIAGETALDVIDAARDRFGSHLPAMILTGDTSPEELSHIAARGIAVYLKPVALTALQDYLQQAVQGSP